MKKIVLAAILFSLPVGIALVINPNTHGTIQRVGVWVQEEMANLAPPPEKSQFRSRFRQGGG